MAGITVACVLRASKEYDAEYVERLADGVAAHLKVAHRFVCLSDVPVHGIDRIPLEHDWPGWWAKIEMFKLPPPVLSFDLDTLIVGDLTDIAVQARKAPLTVLRDFYREGGLGSGMMAWGIDMTDLYGRFASDPRRWQDKYQKRGDQGFMEDHVKAVARWQDAVPGQVVSYKAHVRLAKNRHESGDGTIPAGARVVCFHGRPRPREIGWQV